MIRRACRALLIAAVTLLSASAIAADQIQEHSTAFPIPERYKLVNDFDGALRISTAVKITERLQALERLNGTQIVFLAVPSVGTEGIYGYAVRVFEKWDIGNNRQGNGVLFLASRDGVVILTGPGIAGALPDVKIGRIFRNIIEPRWKKEEYSEGIEEAIDEMIKAARGEDTAPAFYDYLHPITATKPEHIWIGILILFGVAYAVTLLYRRRKRKLEVQ